MSDVIYKDFRRKMPAPAQHKGWAADMYVPSNLDVNGRDGEQRLAERERAVRRSEMMDGVTKKFLKREELRKSLRLVQSDIDRDR